MAKKPINIVMFAVDSLWADHIGCYGYHRLKTPHIDKFAKSGVLFENFFSPHIPTTPGYASMRPGMDCVSTQVVALRDKGGRADQVATRPETLREARHRHTG